MNEITALAAVLGNLKTATDIVKVLRQSVVSLKDAEVNFKIAELLNSLADVKTELAGVQDTIYDQSRAIRELEEQLKAKGDMKYTAPAYWNRATDPADGPFCAVCWEDRGVAIHLVGMENTDLFCKACKRAFKRTPLPVG